MVCSIDPMNEESYVVMLIGYMKCTDSFYD